MRARGFTSIELAIIVTIAAIMVPIILSFSASLEDQSVLGNWQLESAESVRTLSEELRLDARRGVAVDGADVAFSLDGCDVRYVVSDGSVVIREAPATCDGPRGLARFVEALAWTPGGVDVVFARVLRPGRVHRVTVFIPVEGR